MSPSRHRAVVWFAMAASLLLATRVPATANAQPINDHFEVTFTPDGQAVSWSGTGYATGRWYFYPNYNWWNVWFINPPLTLNRPKTIHVEFDAITLQPGLPTLLTAVYNWATPAWSNLGNNRPPLPVDVPTPALEDQYIRRSDPPFFNGPLIGPAHIVHDFVIDEYCPEWISLDIRGMNVHIIGGIIIHECLQGPMPCQPTPDGHACEPAICPAPEEICLPTRVWINHNVSPPDYQILECECKSPDDCRAEIDAADGVSCVGACPTGEMCQTSVTDNGDGTQTIACICAQMDFGACCSTTTPGACLMTDPQTCMQLNGVYMGMGTTCDDTNGNGMADICEFITNDVDYGDAPEDALAYPATGVLGRFPTCFLTGPASYIRHANFGGTFGGFDFDMEGNAGFCPLFNPNTYDKDECFGDGDSGLMFPGAFTIQGPIGAEAVVPCPNSVPTSIGPTCSNAVWGANIDIFVANFMPPGAPKAYVNVLFDWNQDGIWAGGSTCPIAAAPEHVLVNFQVPNGYTGPLSGVMPPPPNFIIGPNAGHVWARFTLSERPVPLGWPGDGVYEDGETEDYLLLIGDGGAETDDFGDAPDPPYPTLIASGGAQHTVGNLFLGNIVDPEANGQPNATATGDDLAGLPDEDGVTFTTLPLIPGQPAGVTVMFNSPVAGALISAWIDFNGDGNWATPGDQIFVAQPINPGANALTFIVPPTATPGIVTFARFRVHTNPGGVPFTGAIPYGEVEDYMVQIGEAPLTPKWWQFPALASGVDSASDFWWVEPTTYVKWTQPPDASLPGLHAHNYDVGMGIQTITLADDWLCQGGDITDLHWWGNYEVDANGVERRGAGIQNFRLSIHSCAPGPTPPWCVPMEPPLWLSDVPFASVGETDTGLLNPEGSKIYFYTAVLPNPFPQMPGTSYWFDLSAKAVDPLNPPLWRWQEARREPVPPLGHAPAAEQLDQQPWRTIVWPPSPPGTPERYSDMAFEVTSISEPPPFEVNAVVADDFRSDGRPIEAIRWWGSYFDDRYAPGSSIDPIHVIDGWFITFHPTDPSANANCPPSMAAVDWPSVLAVYFAPASAVEVTLVNATDCLQHPVYEYKVDLSRCCLLCSAIDPRTGNEPAQPGAFMEVSNVVYWLGIQAVTGATWMPNACGFEDRILTGHQPSDLTPDGHFWGWHTSHAVGSPFLPMEEACNGRILNMTPVQPYPPDCWRYDAWTKQLWMCPNPIPPLPPVHMAFELLAQSCSLMGDVNQDGAVTTDDIPCFVDCLLGNVASGCVCGCADMNLDAKADGQDIQLFVNVLLGL